MIQGVSLIICCHNGEKRIPAVLNHLSAQVFHNDSIPWEILMIDNASTDNTINTALSSWKGDPERLRIIQEPIPGLSHARMSGINNSRFEYLSFIDDDNWVENNWVEKVFNIMKENPGVGICGGTGEPIFNTEPPEWFNDYHDAYAVGNQHSHSDLYVYGAGSTVRKSALMELFDRGFKYLLTGRKGTSLSSGDDYELALGMRLIGYSIYYEPDLKFKHALESHRLTRNYLKKLYSSFGRSYAITELYKSVLINDPFPRSLLTRNRYTSIAKAFYAVLRRSVALVWSYITGKDKEQHFRNIIRLNFTWNSFKEKIRIFPVYNKIAASISNLKKT